MSPNKKNSEAFANTAQGPIEYMLITGVAILIVAITTIALTSTTATGQTQTTQATTTSSNAYTGLEQIMDSMTSENGGGGTQTTAGLTCETIHETKPSFGGGIYWIDPNGGDPSDAYQTYCSMTTNDRYWVSGTGNWTDATAHWATSSGGAPVTANLPTQADNCIIDKASGFSSGGTITIDSSQSNCNNFIAISGHNYTINATNTMNIYGSLQLENGTIIGGNASFNLLATSSGKTITTAGKALKNIIFNGSGGVWTLQDNLSADNSITITAGTLDVGSGKTITALNNLTINGGNINATSNDISITTGTLNHTTGTISTTTSGNIMLNGSGAYVLGNINSIGDLTIGSATIPSKITQTSSTTISGTIINLISVGDIGAGTTTPIAFGPHITVNASTTDGNIYLTRNSGDLSLGTILTSGVLKQIYLNTTTSGNISVGSVNAGSGTVTIIGAEFITDPNGTTINVTGGALFVTDRNGIDLDTSVNSIVATMSGTGTINIDEFDAVTLTNVTTANGAIIITAGGTMTATRVRAGGVNAAVTLTTTAGDIVCGLITATGSAVTLKAAGAIIDGNGVTVNVIASILTMTSTSGIGGIGTNVDTIFASLSGPGNIAIEEANAVTISNMSTNNGSITITAGGTIQATLVRAGGAGSNVSITTTSGDINVGLVTASSGTVTLKAAGTILDYNKGTVNVISMNFIFTAGSMTDDIETNVATITATTTGTGAIMFNESNAVTLANITNNTGAIKMVIAGKTIINRIAAGGAVDVNVWTITTDGNIFVMGPITSGGSITLTSTANIYVGASLTAGNGIVNLNHGVAYKAYCCNYTSPSCDVQSCTWVS